jgi:hypothetical protein
MYVQLFRLVQAFLNLGWFGILCIESIGYDIHDSISVIVYALRQVDHSLEIPISPRAKLRYSARGAMDIPSSLAALAALAYIEFP